MKQRKSLDDIRPAKGLKIKNKEKMEKKKTERKVIPNIEEDHPGKEFPPPTKESLNISNELNKLKQELLTKMRDFNKLLLVKTLPENKSLKEKEQEQEILNNLVKCANDIEKFNSGEGILALCVLSLRHTLTLRDAFNQQSYEISKLHNTLNETNGSKNKEAENEVLKLAKELGINVSIGDK